MLIAFAFNLADDGCQNGTTVKDTKTKEVQGKNIYTTLRSRDRMNKANAVTIIKHIPTCLPLDSPLRVSIPTKEHPYSTSKSNNTRYVLHRL